MTRPHLTSLANRLPWKTSLAFVLFGCLAAVSNPSSDWGWVIRRTFVMYAPRGHGGTDIYLRSVPGGGFEECSDNQAVVQANWRTSASFPGPVFALHAVRSQTLSLSGTSRWDYSTDPSEEIARPAAARALEARFPGKVLPELAHQRNAEHWRLMWSGVILNALFALALLVLILKLAAADLHSAQDQRPGNGVSERAGKRVPMTRTRMNSLIDRLPWRTSLTLVVFSLFIAITNGSEVNRALASIGLAGTFTPQSGRSVYLRSVPGGGFESCTFEHAEVRVLWSTSSYRRGPVFGMYTVRDQSLALVPTPLWDDNVDPTAEIARPAAVRALEARYPGEVLPALAHNENATDRRLRWSGVILNALFALALLVLMLKLAALLVRIFTRRSTDAPPPPAA